MAGKVTTEAANHLRAWRERAKLTQAELAERAGTKAGVISELESGKQQLSDKWLRRFAPILGTTPGFLLDHDPESLSAQYLEAAAQVPVERRAEALEILRVLRGPRG